MGVHLSVMQTLLNFPRFADTSVRVLLSTISLFPSACAACFIPERQIETVRSLAPYFPSDPWQPMATTAFHLGRLSRSWLSAAPGRATLPPFLLNAAPRLPLVSSHLSFKSAQHRMMTFLLPRGDIDVREYVSYALRLLISRISFHQDVPTSWMPLVLVSTFILRRKRPLRSRTRRENREFVVTMRMGRCLSKTILGFRTLDARRARPLRRSKLTTSVPQPRGSGASYGGDPSVVVNEYNAYRNGALQVGEKPDDETVFAQRVAACIR
ncbi:hypothetical protein B0H13DRAFT_2327853 [Mycena leptocephala]|nr:hypothetical protein B0H13DRAFT_2327853 [Mycena leptocephala]